MADIQDKKGIVGLLITVAIVAAGFLIGTWLKNKMGLSSIVGA